MKKELKKVVMYIGKYQNMMDKFFEEMKEKLPEMSWDILNAKSNFNKNVSKIFDGLHYIGLIYKRTFLSVDKPEE